MDQVDKAIEMIEKNNWVEVLLQCQSVKERFDKLAELMPDIRLLDVMATRQLVWYLHWVYEIDFGVCEFYTIENNKQYCQARDKKVECLWPIPEPYCAFRDKDGKPKYPEFSHVLLREKFENRGSAT